MATTSRYSMNNSHSVNADSYNDMNSTTVTSDSVIFNIFSVMFNIYGLIAVLIVKIEVF